jgi:hypothetical protein
VIDEIGEPLRDSLEVPRAVHVDVFLVARLEELRPAAASHHPRSLPR